MKEILIVEKEGKMFFYENMFAFINNNEREVQLSPKDIILITNKIKADGKCLIKTLDALGCELKLKFYSRNMIEVWEKRNGNLIDECDERNYMESGGEDEKTIYRSDIDRYVGGRIY